VLYIYLNAVCVQTQHISAAIADSRSLLLDEGNPDLFRSSESCDYAQYSMHIWVEDFAARICSGKLECPRRVVSFLRKKSNVIAKSSFSKDQVDFFKYRLKNIGNDIPKLSMSCTDEGILAKVDNVLGKVDDCFDMDSSDKDWFQWIEATLALDEAHAILFQNGVSIRAYAVSSIAKSILAVKQLFVETSFSWTKDVLVAASVFLAHVWFCVDGYFHGGLQSPKIDSHSLPVPSLDRATLFVCQSILEEPLPKTSNLKFDYAIEIMIVKLMLSRERLSSNDLRLVSVLLRAKRPPNHLLAHRLSLLSLLKLTLYQKNVSFYFLRLKSKILRVEKK